MALSRPPIVQKAVLIVIGSLAAIYAISHFSSGNVSQTTAKTATIKLDADAVAANVLPFEIIMAIRNYGFKDDLVLASISASVDGGSPKEWAATAIHIAENSIVNGTTCSKVELYVPNPRGDMPPTHPKQLAEVYYAPDIAHCPFSKPEDAAWLIQTALKAGTQADIEFLDQINKLMPDDVDDPDKTEEIAEQRARKVVIQKYGLPDNWTSDQDDLGIKTNHKRSHFDVIVGPNVESSMKKLEDCLSSDGGTRIFRGCYPAALRDSE